MLELRPSCEHCDQSLPADSTEARICSFECTFCHTCVEQILQNVCPNCGGGFTPRPIRPMQNLKGGHCLANYPAQKNKIHRPVNTQEHNLFAQSIRNTPPQLR